MLEKPKVTEVVQSPEAPPPDIGPYSDTENSKLKDLVQQRDNEISIQINTQLYTGNIVLYLFVDLFFWWIPLDL